jgi:hypothetical protein
LVALQELVLTVLLAAEAEAQQTRTCGMLYQAVQVVEVLQKPQLLETLVYLSSLLMETMAEWVQLTTLPLEAPGAVVEPVLLVLMR